MPLTSQITAYDAHWPRRYAAEQARLRPIFGNALTALHHVGSTAVSGLAAKPEIDILAVVRSEDQTDIWQNAVPGMGYRRGGDLSPGHQFYKRDHEGRRTHKLHVIVEGHPKVTELLVFRDLLRTDPALRRAYQALKLRLERENTRGISEYLDGKAPFIDAALVGVAPTAEP
ncbi:MAG: GrpB family protein [Pseudomonadota bacterium]